MAPLSSKNNTFAIGRHCESESWSGLLAFVRAHTSLEINFAAINQGTLQLFRGIKQRGREWVGGGSLSVCQRLAGGGRAATFEGIIEAAAQIKSQNNNDHASTTAAIRLTRFSGVLAAPERRNERSPQPWVLWRCWSISIGWCPRPHSRRPREIWLPTLEKSVSCVCAEREVRSAKRQTSTKSSSSTAKRRVKSWNSWNFTRTMAKKFELFIVSCKIVNPV